MDKTPKHIVASRSRLVRRARGLVACLLLILPFITVACDSESETPSSSLTPSDTARRTVLIYMAAQNSLGTGNWHKSDSVEIVLGRQYVANTDRLLVFIDDGQKPRIYRVSKDEEQPVLVRTWTDDANSTSPDVLRDVLTWMRTKYPASEYGLVLWSHADGWIPSTNKDYASTRRRTNIRPYSFGIDDGDAIGTDDGTQMDVDDMADAINGAGIHLRYLFFDACLMQNIEVAYALKDVTDYVIGSPISTPAAGSNYTHQLRDAFFDDDPTLIVSTYYNDVTDSKQSAQYGDFGGVISAVCTDGMEQLAAKFKKALPYSTLAGRLSPNMDNVLNYQAYTSHYFYRPHNYDAAEAIRQLFPEYAQEELLSALNEVVVRKASTSSFWIGPGDWTYQDVNLDSYCGVSLFVPQDVYTTYADKCSHGDHNTNFKATRWYEAAGWEQTGW